MPFIKALATMHCKSMADIFSVLTLQIVKERNSEKRAQYENGHWSLTGYLSNNSISY